MEFGRQAGEQVVDGAKLVGGQVVRFVTAPLKTDVEALRDTADLQEAVLAVVEAQAALLRGDDKLAAWATGQSLAAVSRAEERAQQSDSGIDPGEIQDTAMYVAFEASQVVDGLPAHYDRLPLSESFDTPQAEGIRAGLTGEAASAALGNAALYGVEPTLDDKG